MEKIFLREGPSLSKSMVVKAWENYMVNDQLNPKINPIIAESWTRSKKTGINPIMPSIPIESEDSFSHYMEQNRLFIDNADSVIQRLRTYIESSNAMIELFDWRGMIIKMYGNSRIIKQAESINNVPGGLWTDEEAGTNAVGLALEHRKPFFVVGAEHYCQTVHEWTCLAFPIFNGSNQNIMGVLDITGPQEVFSSHTFGLVQAGVYAIENLIDKQNIRMDHQLLDFYIQKVSMGVTSIMLINKYRTIIRCTEKAAEIFGGTQAQWTGASVNALALPILSRYLDSTEPEVEFHTTLVNDTDVRVVIKRINIESAFIGWIMTSYIIGRNISKSSVAAKTTTFESLIGRSITFRRTVEMGIKISSSHSNVLLLGETGTGKELFARAIHATSPRREGPFIAVNCGGIPKELIASELFGYEEGAFTGAKKGGAKGKFELANGGTLFLDEIGEMPLEVQVYLLRVLQERAIQRVGGIKEIPIDVRFVAATHIDLADAVERHLFRQDLYFRLHVLTLQLPPLRERGVEDVISLINYFTMMINRKEQKQVSLSKEALNMLSVQSWPGNVRELENAIHRMIVLAEGNMIDLEHLSNWGYTVSLEEKNFPSSPLVPKDSGGTKPKTIDDMEREEIAKAIRNNEGNYSKASIVLGMSRSTLYRKIEKYQL